MILKENDVVFTPDKKVSVIDIILDDNMCIGDSFIGYPEELKLFSECIDKYLETIVSFNPLDHKCKFWNIELEKTEKLIHILYGEYNQVCGGLLHILTDDDNIEDHHIKWCLNYVEENKDNPTAPISKAIAERYLKHSILERLYLSECFYCNISNCDLCELEDKVKYKKEETK